MELISSGKNQFLLSRKKNNNPQPECISSHHQTSTPKTSRPKFLHPSSIHTVANPVESGCLLFYGEASLIRIYLPRPKVLQNGSWKSLLASLQQTQPSNVCNTFSLIHQRGREKGRDIKRGSLWQHKSGSQDRPSSVVCRDAFVITPVLRKLEWEQNRLTCRLERRTAVAQW